MRRTTRKGSNSDPVDSMQRRSDDPKEETGLNDARKLRQSINYDRRNGLHMDDAFGDTSLAMHMAILVMRSIR